MTDEHNLWFVKEVPLKRHLSTNLEAKPHKYSRPRIVQLKVDREVTTKSMAKARRRKKMATIEWPWQYSFPPFFTIQPHAETQAKQITAWRSLILEYYRINKLGVLDVREAQRSPLFYNKAIDRKLPTEGILKVLEDLARTKNAEAIDKTKHIWHIYSHTLEEWGNMIYSWIQNNGMLNTVCTFYELIEGENTVDEEFHGLNSEILIKVLRKLEANNRAEIIIFDDNQGVKFF